MTAPLDTTLIEQRLRDAVPELQAVAGAADYAVIKDLRGFRTPSAYVVLTNQRGPEQPVHPQRRPGATQEVASTVGIIIAVRSYRDNTGAAARAESDALIGATRQALMGWSPQPPMRGMWWQQGDVLDYDADTLLWADVYTINHFMGGNAS